MTPPPPPMTAAPDLTAIVVAHDSGADLATCLASVRAEVAREGLRAELLVVDNASRDGAVEALDDDDLTVLRNDRNVGFGAAVNRGFRAAHGDRVLLLNPDATLREGALRALLDALVDDDVALAAPTLMLPSGEPQESPRRFYDLATVLARRTPAGRLAGPAAASARHVERPCEAGDVDWVTGAAMLLDRTAVPADGPFDERFFLYFEDVDLCRRLAAQGRRVRFVPDAVVDHRFGAASRRQVPWNPLLWGHLKSGLLYAARWSSRWWRSRWWRAAASRGLGFLARAVLLGSVAVVTYAVAILSLYAGGDPPSVLGWDLLGPVLIIGMPAAACVSAPRSRRIGRAALPSVAATAFRLVPVAAVGCTIVGTSVGSLDPLLVYPAVAAVFVGTLTLDLVRRVRRALGGVLRRLGFGHTTVLLAGDPTAAARVAESLAENPEEGLEILGFVPLDPLSAGGPTPRLPGWEDVLDVARDLRAEAVLLAGSADDLARTAAGVDALRRAGVEVSFALTGATELLQPDSSARVGGFPVLPLGSGAAARVAERGASALGRSVAAAGLVVLLPVAPLLLAAAAFASRGTPLVGVPRLGRDLRPFTMWRLRTGDAPESGGGLVGRFLRASHLDELPQLVNVVRGEMALVGPRPVEPAVADRLEPWERARFRIRPGITGMWQLDRLRRWRLEEMVASDLLYLLRWSPALDLRILGETLLGRRTP